MQFLFGSESFEPPHYALYIISVLIFTICYLCYKGILIRVWQHQTPLCIRYHMKFHIKYMICTLQCNSDWSLNASDPLMYYIVWTFIYTICYICRIAILTRNWKFQTPLCITYYMNLHVLYMLFTLQRNSYSGMRVSDPIMYYMWHGLSYILYDIYGTMQFLFRFESSRHHRTNRIQPSVNEYG